MTETYRPRLGWLTAILLLALTGLGLAAYLSREFYIARADAAAEAACDLNAKVSCSDVARTDYAEILPGLPLSTLAGMFFAGMAAIAFLGRGDQFASSAAQLLRLGALLATLASLYYLYVMHYRIHKYCLFCMGIDVVNILLLLCAWLLKPGCAPGSAAGWPKLAGAGVLAALLAWGGIRLIHPSTVAAPSAPSGPINPLTGRPMESAPAAASAAAAPASGAAASSASAPLTEEERKAREEMVQSVQNALTGPVVAVGAGPQFPSDGPADAPITLVEFADFQCPHCAHGFQVLEALRRKYGDKFRVVYRQFPLSKQCNPIMKDWGKGVLGAPADLHPFACESARIALCAHDQGRFHDTASALFGGMEHVSDAGPRALVANLGLDAAQLDRCLADPKSLARVKFDAAEGAKLDIHGTPSFFVNGRSMAGAPPEALDYVIGRLLGDGGMAR